MQKIEIKNEGTAALVIDRVDFDLMGLTARFKPEIQPGADGTIQIEIDTTHMTGQMDLALK